MKDLMNAKLFLKNNMLWRAFYNCSNSSKKKQKKLFLFLRRMSAKEKHRQLLEIEKTALFLRKFIYAPIILKKPVSIKAGHYRHNYFTHHVPRKENL